MEKCEKNLRRKKEQISKKLKDLEKVKTEENDPEKVCTVFILIRDPRLVFCYFQVANIVNNWSFKPGPINSIMNQMRVPDIKCWSLLSGA